MKKFLFTALAVFGLSFGASADTLAQWDFNTNPSDASATTGTLTPSFGTGTAALVGITGGALYNTSGGSSDPTGGDPNNSAWRVINFPAQSTGNKTAGVQFNLNTTGYESITLTWDQNSANSSSKYFRVLYSTDNGVTWVPKDVITYPFSTATWANPIATVSFVTIPGANNNTNFGVRILSEFQSTATGSGTAGYVSVSGGTYNTTGAFRLDMVTFNGTSGTGSVNILTNPVSQVVAVGQPASFSVVAGGGTSAIGFQWRTNGTPIPNATNSSYSIAAAQFSDARDYDVVVTNSVNSATSTVATLTVRTPLNLAWTGLGGATWDTNSVSWVDTGANNVPYTDGDHTLFDSRGAAAPTVSFADSFNPSSVTVDADFDYTFRSDVAGKLVGTTGLTKRGSGTLFIDTDNTYSGATDIQAGIVQLGLADAHGSLGSGPITNNGALVINRTGTFTIGNAIDGSGSITNLGTGATTLANVNNFNGRLSANAGTLTLGGNQTINSPDIFVTASTASGPSGATKFALGGGLVVSAGTTIHFTGLNGALDYRATFQSLAGTNIINGPTILEGTGSAAFETAGVGTLFTINGNVSGSGFTGALFLRGANGSGIVNGTINLPGLSVLKPDTSVWTINSTNNAWSATTIAGGGFRLGAHNALPTNMGLTFSVQTLSGFLDLAGFNQQIAALGDASVAIRFITNSSATADSTLTVGSGTYGGTIADSAAGRKTGLTISGGTLTLSGSNPYSGDTTVSAGTLALSGSGEIPNSTIINLAGGGLDVLTKNDGTLTVSATQTLKGNGTLAVNGSLVNNGIIELKINKSGTTLTGDSIQGINNLTYGGTLNLVLSGSALVAGDNIKLFTATAYSGAFANIIPATPGAGLLWDTSTLTTDGTLRVTGSGVPSVTTTSQSGTNVVFSGTGGPANGIYYVLSSTNIAAPIATWTPVQTNQFDATGNFSVTNAIAPNIPQNFYILQIP